jgi:hypothetical protein
MDNLSQKAIQRYSFEISNCKNIYISEEYSKCVPQKRPEYYFSSIGYVLILLIFIGVVYSINCTYTTALLKGLLPGILMGFLICKTRR